MISLLLDESYDVIPTLTTSGLITLETSKFPKTNSQLVPLRIFTKKQNREYEPENAIDWELFFGEQYNSIDSNLLNLFASQLELLISRTIGVTSVDLSNAKVSNLPDFIFTDVCFTIDCNTYTL